MAKPRVLLVAFHFPPLTGSSGVQRALTFARYLPEFGWEPLVLTAHPRAYESTSDGQLTDVPPGLVVHRAFALDAKRHLSVRGFYPGWAARPDRWAAWALGAIPAGLRLVRRYRPHAIWSTYPIATAHVVGAALHRLTGLPWVADFRDPMAFESYPPDPRKRALYRRIERRTVARAARSVVTAPGAARAFAARYPEVPAERWAVIPNGYDEGPFRDAEALAPARRAPGAVTLVHSGILYPSERDPRGFFAALATLKREGVIRSPSFRVVLRGSAHDETHRELIRRAGIEDLVFLEPQVPYREALAEMLAADGLLLFQAANCNDQVPAKVYEYFRARRPILGLTDPEGDTAAVLREAGVDTTARLDSEAEITAALRRFLALLRDGRAPVPAADEVSRHSRLGRAGMLAQLLEEAAAIPAPVPAGPA